MHGWECDARWICWIETFLVDVGLEALAAISAPFCLHWRFSSKIHLFDENIILLCEFSK